MGARNGISARVGSLTRSRIYSLGVSVMSAMPLSRLSFVWCYKCDGYVVGPLDHPATLAQEDAARTAS